MGTPRLNADEFAAFFTAIQGNEPFPWQERLARTVFEKGWPAALDVPTGAGKTAAIDVAVFHLALEATQGSRRSAPVRIVFVVDRRIVVDEAHRRAMDIARALEGATGGVLVRVRERLRLLSEPGKPALAVAKLRGGAPKEPDWIRTPGQPAVIVSTVDQVGSRLFFRGYGVSDSMRPVHAGLLGSDALYLLDEAHLSQPFVQSVRASRDYQEEGPWSADAARAPFHVVTLSATQAGEVPALMKSDDRKHPVLGPRLGAKKPVELALTPGGAGSKEWVEACAERAWGLSAAGDGSATTIALVVNRIARARALHAALSERVAAAGEADIALLIGPSRPLDRERKLADILPRIASRERATNVRPLFVVATQCIEAGADLDFDAMVTELAPLDSLRQRFGRLNRTGRDIVSRGIVVASAEQVGGRAKEDPIYGRSLGPTWELLSSKADGSGKSRARAPVVDFGILAAEAWLPPRDELGPYLAPRADAPVLLPAYVRQWTSTSAPPIADPEVSLFLHGARSGPPDVQVVWRADLSDALPELWRERVAVCPPSALEAVSVPLYAARDWLLAGRSADIADVESAPVRDELVGDRPRGPVLRWRGADAEETKQVSSSEIRPGDLLVVPASYGGLDAWGWSPRAGIPVSDLGREANRRHRGLDVLRFTREVVAAAWTGEGLDADVAQARAAKLEAHLMALRDESEDEAREVLATEEWLPPEWREVVRANPGKLVRYEEAEELAGIPFAFVRRIEPEEPTGAATTEDDESSRSTEGIPLSDHSVGARELAGTFAKQAGLSDEIADAVALAAFLHDTGKAHPDFKRWLYDGDELAAFAGPDLAKSGRRLGPRARDRARLPAGARHEVASLSFAASLPAFFECADPDLVLWLVGTHHGHGRPFFPAVEWPPPGSTFLAEVDGSRRQSAPAPTLASLTAGWCDLEAKLTRKYGPWGLARLEAVLRLADHRRSQHEEIEQKGEGR